MIIGIDPDIDKNGVAVCVDGKITELHNLKFFEVIDFILEHQENIKKVVIEAGWLIPKNNWHGIGKKLNVGVRENIAKKVGENHATGKHLNDFIQALGIKTQLLKPQGKIKTIKGHGGAPDRTSSDIFNKITGWTEKSNPETRDAAMLVFGMR